MTKPSSGQSTSEPIQPSLDDLPLSGVRDRIAGIGGVIRQQPEDFVVEEIPAYEPSGTGEHLFLWIEKRGISSEQLTHHIARQLDISNHDVGVAGLKDRWAVARQYVSVPAKVQERVPGIENEQVRVLHAACHRNKLRSGHLRGNRFDLLVRDAAEDALQRATEIGQRIVEAGFPNYFGPQRFGRDGDTLTTGLALLTGKTSPRQIPRSRRKFLLRLSLSAAQSYLFNCWVGERISDGLLHEVLQGDVMQVVSTGGPFLVENLPEEQRRFDTGETAVTGPIFGPKMKSAVNTPGAREQEIVKQHGLTGEDFRRFPRLTSGTRRPSLIRPTELSIEPDPDGLRFRFILPRGVYATSLLREFMLP